MVLPVHINQWFLTLGNFCLAPPHKGTLGDNWRYFWLSQVEWGEGNCYCLIDRGQRCCQHLTMHKKVPLLYDKELFSPQCQLCCYWDILINLSDKVAGSHHLGWLYWGHMCSELRSLDPVFLIVKWKIQSPG